MNGTKGKSLLFCNHSRFVCFELYYNNRLFGQKLFGTELQVELLHLQLIVIINIHCSIDYAFECL